MKKINRGLKLWSTNDFYIENAEKALKKGQCEYLELYVIPDSFEKYSDKWKNLSAKYIIHAPHYANGMNLAKIEKFNSNQKLAEEAKRFADYLDSEYIIFHPGIDGEIEETARQISIIKDERFLIENKPYYALVDNLVCNGNSVEDIRFVIDNCKVGFCFDLGHAICSANARKVDRLEYLLEFNRLIPKMYHLTDGDYEGILDRHDNYGCGNFPVEKLVRFIPEKALLTNEAKKSSKENLNDFLKDMEFLENICVNDYSFVYNGDVVEIRRAEIDDAMKVYAISNDPIVRKNSFKVKNITIEEHLSWFNKKLADENYVIYLFANKKEVVSVIRFEIADNEGVMGISISEKYRGLGLSDIMIKKSVEKLLTEKKILRIKAYIKSENEASKRAFFKANFEYYGEIKKEEISERNRVLEYVKEIGERM